MTVHSETAAASPFDDIADIEQEPSAEFSLGARRPDFAVRPKTIAAAAKVIARAARDRLAVVCFGGGTLQGIGLPPQRYNLALDMTRLSHVLSYDPRDLTISVEAGMRLGDLDRTLANAGQFLPLDAPNPARATVGGTLAAGWLGPRRHHYGRARDFVIGSATVLADGSIAHAGGKVVKNVTGYDMSKLYIGSLGTLGAIASVNFRTLPLPSARRLATAALPEGTLARVLAHLAGGLIIEPAAMLYIAGFEREIDGHAGHDGRLIFLFEGSQVSVDRSTRELRSALGAAGVPETVLVDRETGAAFSKVLDAYVAVRQDRAVTYRMALELPLQSEPLAAIRHDLESQGAECETIADLCNGDLIIRCNARTAGTLRGLLPQLDAAVHALDPAARIIALPDALRGMADPWGITPALLPLMRRVKEQFDPHGVFAPGRFVGGL